MYRNVFGNVNIERNFINKNFSYCAAWLFVKASWNVMAHAQKPDFVFRPNRRVHLNRRGRQFSRLLAAEVCASAVVMLDTPCSEVVWRVLAIHSIRQFPLHLPSRASPRPSHFNWSLLHTFICKRWKCCLNMYADSPRTNLRKSYAFDQCPVTFILLLVWRSRIKYRKTSVSVNFHKTFMAATQPVIWQQFNVTAEDVVSLQGFLIDGAITYYFWRSQWPRGLRRGSVVARLLRSWVRNLPVA